MEKRLAEGPVIAVPTITRKATPMERLMRMALPIATNSRANPHRIITGGIGHNLPQEARQAFAQSVVDVSGS